MKKYLILLSLLLSSNIICGQEMQASRLVLGVGNESFDTYKQVINILNTTKDIKVLNTCDEHRIIVISDQSEQYRTFNDLFDFLKSEIEDLKLYLKDDQILYNECLGDIIKQNKK